ncbi:MAG: DUF3828 domain-containing protein [Hyphomonadaceae bacterium]|nr:DUF3828 domain-containing protein [Hyphomonadaceae bacterium]
MTFRTRLVLLAAIALAACAPAPPGPDAAVDALYAPYLQAGGAPPPLLERDIFTPELKAEIDRATTYANLLDTPVIDYDPVVGAQDWEIKAVSVAEIERAEDAARVVARFDNMGAPQEVAYAMRLVDGVWRVDDIGAGEDSLRGVIAAGLKPAGDPAAMEAPVRAIYDRYAAATRPVEPLHRWGALTEDLRRRLSTAAAMGARADAQVLDFDPVLDGKTLELGPVAYEAAAAGVIARFDNAGEPRIVVYDLVEENGGWLIADIRSPGHWALGQKLTEAGIE